MASTSLKPYIGRRPRRGARFSWIATGEDRKGLPAQPDGRVLLRFPRLFILATRRVG